MTTPSRSVLGRTAAGRAAEDRFEFVLASNRGPLSFVRAGEGYAPSGGIGAVSELLASGGKPFGEKLLWIACAVSDEDCEAVARPSGRRAIAAVRPATHYLAPPRETFRGYYDEISNRVLWLACHDLWEDLELVPPVHGWEAAWGRYDAVNEAFAEAVAERAGATAAVSFHDYHLLGAPRHLRRRRPEQPIGLFLHVPWSRSGFGVLPRALLERIVLGMLGADVVGFHIARWGDEFLATCADLGLDVDVASRAVASEGRTTRVRAYPAPAEADAVLRSATSPEANAWARRLRALGDGPLIVRTDRIEPSKNAVRGFEAFELLLERGDAVAAASTFVASLFERRATLAEYRAYRRSLDEALDRLARRWPGRVEVFVDENRPRALAALRVFDVLLVNSIRDGMNLVAKEGALLNERDGVLVLSATTGAAAELGEAAVVVDDPRDVGATADALGAALRMGAAERANRRERLRSTVASRTPHEWLAEQLEDLVGR